MKKNRFTIKTKEMIIEPVDESDVWEGEWNIILRADKPVTIGTASFAGEKMLGAVPVSINLEEKYRNQGYGTLAFKLLVDFAFGYKNIYEVYAVAFADNDACISALEKAGFVRREKNGKTETYSIYKPKTVWLGIYIYIGLIAGLVIGIVINMPWVGLIIGLIIGFILGAILDSDENKKREEALGTRDNKG